MDLTEISLQKRATSKSKVGGKSGSRVYDVEGMQILVSWREFLPPGKKPLLTKVVFLFPGWPLRTEAKSIQELCEELAYKSGARTYAINTRNEQVIPDSLYQEAKAICKFIEESEIKNITLVGHSQGGVKAIDTTIYLQQKYSDIHIDGLILLGSAGLYDIESGKLARKYILDTLVETPPSTISEVVRKYMVWEKGILLLENVSHIGQVFLDVLLAILKEIKLSKRSYLARFKNELDEMSKINPFLDQIRVPIVLIQGTKDHVSDRERIISRAEENKIIQTVLRGGERENSLTLYNKTREQFLKITHFPQSPYIRMMEAEKFGTHGLPLYRSKTIARVSLYLLERWWRKAEGSISRVVVVRQ